MGCCPTKLETSALVVPVPPGRVWQCISSGMEYEQWHPRIGFTITNNLLPGHALDIDGKFWITKYDKEQKMIQIASKAKYNIATIFTTLRAIPTRHPRRTIIQIASKASNRFASKQAPFGDRRELLHHLEAYLTDW